MNSFENMGASDQLTEVFMKTWIQSMNPDYTVNDEVLKSGIIIWISYMETLHGPALLENPLIANFLAANTECDKFEEFEKSNKMIEAPSDDSDQSEFDDYDDNLSCKTNHDQRERDFSPEPSRFASIYTPQEPPFQRRMRLPNPCDNCRKAKRRCDEKDTCWKCKKNKQVCKRIPSAREKRRQEKKHISVSRLQQVEI